MDGCRSARALGALGAGSVVATADGRSVYVASDVVAVFRRDPRRGALSQLPGRSGCLRGQPEEGSAPRQDLEHCAEVGELINFNGLAVSPDGRSLYAVDDQGAMALFRRNRSSGALTQLRGKAGCLNSIRIPGCSRARALGGESVAVSPDGRSVYVAGEDGVAIFRRSPRTGALTQLAGRAGCVGGDTRERCARGRAVNDGSAVAVSADGRSVYVTSWTATSWESGDEDPIYESALAIFRRDRSTGALAQLAKKRGCVGNDLPGCAVSGSLDQPSSVAVSHDGRSVYVGSWRGVVVLRRDPRSGALVQGADRAGCLSWDKRRRCTPGRLSGYAHALALSADGRSAYVGSDAGVAVLRRNRRDGALVQLPGEDGCHGRGGAHGCAAARGVVGPSSVALSADGRNLYAASSGWVAGAHRTAVAVFARRAP